jgi:CDGSH-type Zn-finger protein
MKKHRANHEIRPTGYEIVEFLDAPGVGDATVIETCPVALTQSDGTVEIVQRTVLCRCGHSAAKPSCDGSHARCGFVAPGTPAPGHQWD